MSAARCFGENLSCASASGTHAPRNSFTRKFIFHGDCGMSFFEASMTTLLLVLALLTGFFAALADPDAAADDSHHRLVCCCAVGVDPNEHNETLLTPKQVRSILETGDLLFGGFSF